MSLENVLAEDRRLVILRALSESGYRANESVLRKGLDAFGHRVGAELVRADLEFLRGHGLVRIEVLHPASGDLWLVHLTDAGNDVASGTYHPGVARRGPAG
jgi:hypothetical protein